MKPDLLAVLDASYRMGGADNAWLKGVLEEARPALDTGLGVLAFTYNVSSAGELKMGAPVTAGFSEDQAARVVHGGIDHFPALMKQVFRNDACSTTSEAFANEPGAYRYFVDQGRALGIYDALFINATDPSGSGCVFCANLPARTRLPTWLKDRWRRVAAHIAAGRRLRARLATRPDIDLSKGAEAVLSSTGKLEHAEPEAKSRPNREALRREVIRRERARGRLRRAQPDEALFEWRGLVAARWTLIDQFERGGKRYLVARRNDVALSALALLSERERQAVAYAALGHSNKLIAYELGLSVSTVGVLLLRAARKLGVRRRADLIAAFKQSLR